MTRPTPPVPAIRDAATVVVVRPRPAGMQLLMLRRSAGSPFMPSTLVFPGGRLDPDDGSRDDDEAWVRAARRECREEANLDLGAREMTWFDTWLTPSAEPQRRYLARFYLATLEHDAGDDARADGHETHDERWAALDEHLHAWREGSIDLPPPTLAILLRLSAAGHEGLRARIDHDARDPILPKFVAIDGRAIVVMPHDPQYDALPGDGLPAPRARLEGLPHRFVRDGNRWRPF